MKPILRSCGEVSSELIATGWGSRFTVRGSIAVDQLQPILGGVIADMQSLNTVAAVCDYREADMRIAARSILVAHQRAWQGAKDWPTALVVSPAHVETWRDYALLQGQRGNLRRVFTEEEPAQRWAREQAALREVHIRWLERAQSRQ